MLPALITIPFLLATVIAAGLLYASARQAPSRLARAFRVLATIAVVWSSLWWIGVLVPDAPTKFYIAHLRCATAALFPIAMLHLVNQLAGKPRRLGWWWIPGGVPVVISFVLALTSPFHSLYLVDLRVAPATGLVVFEAGPWLPLQRAMNYMVMVAALVWLAIGARRAGPPFKQQLWLAFISFAPAVPADLIFSSRLLPLPGYSLAPICLSFAGVCFFLAMRRHLFLDVTPVLRQDVVDLVSDVMVVVDARGRLWDLNQAGRDLFGLAGELPLGRRAVTVIPQLDRLLAKEAVPPSIELDVRGDRRIYDVRVSPVHESGALKWRIFVLHDETDRTRREEDIRQYAARLEEVDRLKDGFVAAVSHELRTPLSSILGLTEVLLDEPLAPEARRYVRQLRGSGETLLALINDILDASKIKSGMLEVECVPFSVSETLESALESFSSACEKKGLALSWYWPAKLPAVLGDPLRVRQIVVNLLGNAVKFTAAGSIRVQAEHEANTLTIRVVDTGPGVPAEQRSLIFEEFRQGDAPARHAGTGLGLAIARRLARLMDGDVTVEPNPAGGSIFTATLVLPYTPITLAERFEPVKAGGPVVLLVDDSLRLRFLTEQLQWLGLTVEVVHRWADVVERCAMRPRPGGLWIDAAEVTREKLVEARQRLPLLATVPTLVQLNLEGLTRWRMAGVELSGVLVVRRPIWNRELRSLATQFVTQRSSPISDSLPPVALLRSSGQLRRVLIVDDSVENQLLVGAFLKDQPLELVFANDGKQGVDRFRTERYDLVFLDLEMPVMDGYTAIREMRAWEREQGLTPTPIIAMTAHGSAEHIARTAAAGFSHHVTRPVPKRALLELIDQFAPAADEVTAKVAGALH